MKRCTRMSENTKRVIFLALEKEVLGIYVSGHPLEEQEECWRKNSFRGNDRLPAG